MNRIKRTKGIVDRIKAVGIVFRSCFFVIFIDENRLDNHTYEINDITAAIEMVRRISRKSREFIIIYYSLV